MRSSRYLSSATLYALVFLAALTVQTQIAASQDSSTSSPGTQTTQPVPPPLSVKRAEFFKNNPAAYADFLSKLPRHPAGPPQATRHRAVPATSGTWQVSVNPFPPGGSASPLLLTDGTVIVANGDTPTWYKLTPDINGSYVNGTWTRIASLPLIDGQQYAPLYHASVVLPDGRVLIMGGEYNDSNDPVWTSLGAIYDPVANTWTAVTSPSGWTIGDAESTILADGTFMLAACCNNPDSDALFDASNLTWTSTGAPNAGQDYQDEQGYELLPSGDVLTIDVWTNYPDGDATNAERYNPSSGTWSSAGNTPVSLVDPAICGTWEIGPAVLRPDGTVVAFGANTDCLKDPSLPAPTAIYDSSANTWSSGPDVPEISGKYYDLADAPAALLPDGNVLFAASPGYGDSPTHFFEFSTSNTIAQVADTVDYSGSSGSYYYNFLVLPSGQIMATDFSSLPEFYTPAGSPKSSWAPVISSAPSSVTVGSTYTISGTQFNGLSQGGYYGDDYQGATNYPLVRITNNSTSHVFYARTTNPSNSSVAPGDSVSVSFTVAESTETGASSLVVVANGIASTPVSVTVAGPATTVTVTPASLAFGNLAVNTTSTAKKVTLKNTGTATLDITSIVASAEFAVSTTTCGSTLAIKKSCTVSVTFKPTALGAQTGTLTFTDSATGSPQTVSLSGTGIADAKLTPASTTFAKTKVGSTSAAKTFTLTNEQNVSLNSISISTTGAFDVSTTTCGSTLAEKAKCTISVEFKPTATGLTTGSLSVSDSGSNSPQTAALKGTGD